jgi:chromatin segregation and condensation protein Rec8/ScpA/Scc1 (kleisin family)
MTMLEINLRLRSKMLMKKSNSNYQSLLKEPTNLLSQLEALRRRRQLQRRRSLRRNQLRKVNQKLAADPLQKLNRLPKRLLRKESLKLHQRSKARRKKRK